MSVLANGSGSFLSEVAKLSQLLNQHGRAIFEVHYNDLAFGSWVLVAGTRHKRLRLTWDGKEALLDVSTANFSSSGAIPNWAPISGISTVPDGRSVQGLATSLERFIVEHSKVSS
jgi:hypothetical protein